MEHEGRSRSRRLIAGVASSLGSRAIGLIAPLILIPYAINAIGAERYGLWAAATALTAMVVFADFGLGNGLMTRLTVTLTQGDLALARTQISSAYLMTAVGGLVILAAVWVADLAGGLGGLIDPNETVPRNEANALVTVCLVAFAVNVPLFLIQRVQFANQQVPLANAWLAVSGVMSLAGFVVAHETGASAVGAVAAAVFAVPLTSILNSIIFYVWQKPELRPWLARPELTLAWDLLRLGSLFLVTSILTAIALNIDPVLISRKLGLAEAAEYAVAFRLTSTLALLVTLVNLPLWPANGEALARGDVAWVKRTTRRMTLASTALVALGALALLGPLRPAIDKWLGDGEVSPSQSLMVALSLWAFVLAATSPLFMIQNASGLLWPQIVGWVAFLAISLPVKWWALGAFGVAGAPAVAAATYALVVMPAAAYGAHLSLRRARTRAQQTVSQVPV